MCFPNENKFSLYFQDIYYIGFYLSSNGVCWQSGPMCTKQLLYVAFPEKNKTKTAAKHNALLLKAKDINQVK